MKYIDIHGHINFPDYDVDREEVIKRAHDVGVGMIVVGTDLETSKKCVELAEKHEDMWATIGMHPTEISQPFNIQEFQALASHPKVVAIGECGLEYFNSKPEEIAYQKEIFIKNIEVANVAGKPLMLHVRNKSVRRLFGGSSFSPQTPLRGIGENLSPQADALNIANVYQDTIQILKDHAKVPADFHFFAGTMQDMNDALQIGCSISFTGVVTFARNYDELIKSAPLGKIMTETDCPFVAPIPYRGKRNEPIFVIEVVKQIAKIRGEDENVVTKQVLSNAREFFKI